MASLCTRPEKFPLSLSSFSFFFPFCFHGVATLWDHGQGKGVRHSLCSLSISFCCINFLCWRLIISLFSHIRAQAFTCNLLY
ncbi:hypothetical protein V8C40DRAFT_185848 [Trichoderma camerunense]